MLVSQVNLKWVFHCNHCHLKICMEVDHKYNYTVHGDGGSFRLHLTNVIQRKFCTEKLSPNCVIINLKFLLS
jgi:hypothetical protein